MPKGTLLDCLDITLIPFYFCCVTAILPLLGAQGKLLLLRMVTFFHASLSFGTRRLKCPGEIIVYKLNEVLHVSFVRSDLCLGTRTSKLVQPLGEEQRFVK